MKPYLKTHFLEKVRPALLKELELKNVHQVPTVEKVVLNTGFDASVDRGTIEDIVKDLSNIAGQKAVIAKARKSVSNFKLRQGMPIGAFATLRGDAMWEFLYRFIAIALPTIRDFRGVNNKLDGHGNYSIGITDHTIFPEISGDNQKHHMGLDVTIVTSADTDDQGRALLKHLGMPFRKREGATAQAA